MSKYDYIYDLFKTKNILVFEEFLNEADNISIEKFFSMVDSTQFSSDDGSSSKMRHYVETVFSKKEIPVEIKIKKFTQMVPNEAEWVIQAFSFMRIGGRWSEISDVWRSLVSEFKSHNKKIVMIRDDNVKKYQTKKIKI